MRKLFRVVCGLAAGVAFGLGAGSVTAQTDPPRTASVLHLQGQARASSDHMTWHKLANGSVIRPGTLIQTAENTTLDMVLAKPITGGGANAKPDQQDAGMVRLLGNSVLGIDQLSSEHVGDDLVEDIELDLRAGEISGVAGKPAAGAKYEIKFAKGIVGMRGASYRMTAGGLVTVMAGEAVVVTAGADGSTNIKVVTSGNQFDPSTGMVSAISDATMPPPSRMQPTPPPAENPSAPTAPKPPAAGRPLRSF